jgi:hypothetical protein
MFIQHFAGFYAPTAPPLSLVFFFIKSDRVTRFSSSLGSSLIKQLHPLASMGLLHFEVTIDA